MYELMVIGNPKLETEQVLALVSKTLKDADAKDIKILKALGLIRQLLSS